MDKKRLSSLIRSFRAWIHLSVFIQVLLAISVLVLGEAPQSFSLVEKGGECASFMLNSSSHSESSLPVSVLSLDEEDLDGESFGSVNNRTESSISFSDDSLLISSLQSRFFSVFSESMITQWVEATLHQPPEWA